MTNLKFAAHAAALCLAAILLTQTAQAAGDPEAGAKLAYTCLGCHGIDGYRNAYPSYRVPKLGGQSEAYLAIALTGYRDGSRSHPTMQAQAQSLSEQEIQDVAAYFASVASETVAAGGTKGASFDKAQACAACHGENGISISPTWPTLAGQHEEYLEYALRQYMAGPRGDAVMQAHAAHVAQEDVKMLARYFAGIDGLETTRPE